MLFERIRRTQKPVFIFLALMFGGGFVLLGVGSGVGGPTLGDLVGDNAAGGASIGDLRERVEENPRDAQAWQRLAGLLQAEGRRGEAIAALTNYLELRPEDDLQVAALATLYEQRAAERAAEAQRFQQVASAPTAATSATAVGSLKLGSALTHPVADAVAAPLQERASTAQSRALSDYQQAVALRKTAVELQPGNASYQFGLATVALNAQDYPTALTALREYLELEPDAPNARDIRRVIRQLEPFADASAGGG
jgi:tetratricopeptide (TPR) repeat protein